MVQSKSFLMRCEQDFTQHILAEESLSSPNYGDSVTDIIRTGLDHFDNSFCIQDKQNKQIRSSSRKLQGITY